MEKDPNPSDWNDFLQDQDDAYYEQYFQSNGEYQGYFQKHVSEPMDDELQSGLLEFKYSNQHSFNSKRHSCCHSRASSKGSQYDNDEKENANYFMDTRSCSQRKESEFYEHNSLANELAMATESNDGCVEATASPYQRQDIQADQNKRQGKVEMMRKKPWLSREERIFCNCEKTKCLKMYCTCFRNGVACGVGCHCKGCANNKDQVKEDSRMVRESQCRSKVKEEVEGSREIFCNCRTSFCEKSYCACARAKVACSARCKCFHCKNCFGPRSTLGSMPISVY